MNGERPQVNGQHPLNGATSTQHHQATEAKTARSAASSNGPSAKPEPAGPYMNGVHVHEALPPRPRATPNGLDQAPQEILDLVSREHYLPIASLINRRTQTTWSGLSALLDELTAFEVPIQHAPPGIPISNQTRENLNKKDKLLHFLRREKEDFIKLLVLLQWGKTADQVAKTISVSQWLAQRRQSFWNATGALAALKRDTVGFQIPNPDITTAGEVLSTAKVSSFPNIGYDKLSPLSRKQILTVLKRLDRALSLRLSLLQELPPHLRNFSIHDGRATFMVPSEFDLDLSVLDESLEAPFRLVDFRFTFRPRPAIPDYLHSEIERSANQEIESNGLQGCYQFLHELTLSNKLIEFHKQALDLARNQWSGHMRIELLRRNLVIQYWVERTISNSWLDIGINKGALGIQSYLAVRWFREGQEVTDFEIELDLADLSLESLFSQVVAQHSSWILDSFYHKLVAVPLFNDDGLLVEQSLSSFDPEDCFLRIQVIASQEIVAAIDPITGSVKVSPASDQVSRLRTELNRSKTLLQDFVPRILNYRCTVAEAVVKRTIADTPWEPLSAFRPTSADIRTVFACPISRINFFQHPAWSKEHLFAITHGPDGDKMWILEQALNGETVSFVRSQIVHREALDLTLELNSDFLEGLAEYASRLIVVHTSANTLRARGWKCQYPPRKSVEEMQSPRLLSFNVGGGLHKEQVNNVSEHSTNIQLDYVSLDTISKVVKLSATIRTDADARVLTRLADSNPDERIVFAPQNRQITFKISSIVGKPVVDDIVAQVTRVHDLTTCIQTVQSISTMSLTSISMSAMTIAYEIGENNGQSMNIRFPATEIRGHIDFQPAESNPHVRLGASLSRMLNEKATTFASRLKDVISCLMLTGPLISTLRDIERSLQSQTAEIPNSQHSKIQAHVLVRQPTMFALQFFTRPKGQKAPSGTQSRLLARFEILPQSHGNNSWLVRPAMEEFNQYSKASFASPALQAKVKEEVFSKSCADWIRLDTAAVCLAEKPQSLLKALKQVMIDWVEREEQQSQAGSTARAPVQPPGPAQPPSKPSQQAPPGGPTNSNASNKPATKQGQGRTNQGPNGVNAQQQRPRLGPGKPSQANTKNKDVITID